MRGHGELESVRGYGEMEDVFIETVSLCLVVSRMFRHSPRIRLVHFPLFNIQQCTFLLFKQHVA